MAVVGRVGAHALDEGAVDLDLADRQGPQVRQRRVAGAEVVEREPDAQVAEARRGRRHALRVGHDRALGDLEVSARRMSAVPRERRRDLGGSRRRAGQRNETLTATCSSGRPRATAGTATARSSRRAGERAHEAGLLGERDETSGGRTRAPGAASARAPPRRRRAPCAASAFGWKWSSSSPALDARGAGSREREAVARVRSRRGRTARSRCDASPWPRTWRRRRAAAAPRRRRRGPGRARSRCSRRRAGEAVRSRTARRRAAPDPVGELAARPRAGRVEQHAELVATEPREQCPRRAARPEARPDLLQQQVAGVVAERVVQLLELVEVDDQQRERGAVGAGDGDRLLGPL